MTMSCYCNVNKYESIQYITVKSDLQMDCGVFNAFNLKLNRKQNAMHFIRVEYTNTSLALASMQNAIGQRLF